MKKFVLDLVRGNLSLTWIFFILGSFIPIAIFFISWKFDLKNFPITLAVYMFFASIIVWKTAMKNPNHYAQGLAILLSAVCLFVGGVVILGVLVVLIFSGIDFLTKYMPPKSGIIPKYGINGKIDKLFQLPSKFRIV